jgi:O-acetylserine/cysteine efflux transporter
MTSPLPLLHALLALLVITIWGSNFVVIKESLGQFPPILFAALRFVFALLPAIFFVKRPPVPLWHLAAYGLLIGVGQFGLLYYAMDGHISPGLASVVMQSQAFFTIFLTMLIEREWVKPIQGVALLFAAAGIGIIALHTDTSTTGLGLILALIAATSWAGGNVVARQSGRVNMLAYVVWGSLFSAPPLLVLSAVFEGPARIAEAVTHADLYGWAGVLWQSYGNTLVGYVAWGWLLARHPAATIAPTALLVPIVGLASAVWWLNEPLPFWKIAATALVVGGVALNMLWPRIIRPAGSST